MNYLNDALPFLVNCKITEYDIQSGNTSVMRHYKLAPNDVIDKIASLPKEQRVVQVGLLQKNNPEFARSLEAGFSAAVNTFLEQNDLDQDLDVLCIRRDAVFVINKPVPKPLIGKDILFRPKHVYHAAIQIERLHFFFERGEPPKVDHFIQASKDTKGVLEKLQRGMTDFLQEFVELCENTNMDRPKIYQYLAKFASLYKERRLDAEYYREFTRDALFRLRTDEGETFLDEIPDYLVEDLDISYNYMHIFIPLCQAVMDGG